MNPTPGAPVGGAALMLDAEALYLELRRGVQAMCAPATRLAGITSGGAWLAERLHKELGITTPLGVLDVSYYRDDFDQAGLKKQVRPSQIPFDMQGCHVLLVDDVLYTGHTIRAAMNELFDYGRPASIDLAVLADRGGRELPIEARYCGGRVDVPAGKMIMLERSDAGRAAVNERLEGVASAVEALTRRLEAEAEAQAEAGPDPQLARIAEGQERLVALVERNAADSGIDGGDAESRMRLRSIDVQMLKLLEEVAAGRQESMADLRGDLAELTRAVRALGRAAEQGRRG